MWEWSWRTIVRGYTQSRERWKVKINRGSWDGGNFGGDYYSQKSISHILILEEGFLSPKGTLLPQVILARLASADAGNMVLGATAKAASCCVARGGRFVAVPWINLGEA